MSNNFVFSSPDQGNVSYEFRRKDDRINVLIREKVDGVTQPVRFGFCNIMGKGENSFMTIQAALRQKDADGNYLTQAREQNGQFIGVDGKPVESEAEAAREYVYLRRKDDDSKFVYGNIATVNVKNDKADGTPTKFTMLSVKSYTDDEALEGARLVAKLGIVKDKFGRDSEEYGKVEQDVRQQSRSTGTFNNYFIKEGHDFLRELGFEVREQNSRKASEQESQPEM